MAGNPGNNVTVPTSLVDRGRGDLRNIMGVIVDRDQNGMYRVAVKTGLLTGKYAKYQFDLCVQKLLVNDDISWDKKFHCAQMWRLRWGGGGVLKVM